MEERTDRQIRSHTPGPGAGRPPSGCVTLWERDAYAGRKHLETMQTRTRRTWAQEREDGEGDTQQTCERYKAVYRLKVCVPPKTRASKPSPSVTASVGESLGGEQVMSVEPPQQDGGPSWKRRQRGDLPLCQTACSCTPGGGPSPAHASTPISDFHLQNGEK